MLPSPSSVWLCASLGYEITGAKGANVLVVSCYATDSNRDLKLCLVKCRPLNKTITKQLRSQIFLKSLQGSQHRSFSALPAKLFPQRVTNRMAVECLSTFRENHWQRLDLREEILSCVCSSCLWSKGEKQPEFPCQGGEADGLWACFQ